LQANISNFEYLDILLRNNKEIAVSYRNFVGDIVDQLKQIAFATRVRKPIKLLPLNSYEILAQFLDQQGNDFAYRQYLKRHWQEIATLVVSQKPLWFRAVSITSSPVGFVNRVTQHLTWHSPVLRFGLRLAITTAIVIAEMLHLERLYWVILTIVLIMQSGYVATRTKITARMLGTIFGLILGTWIVLLGFPVCLLVVIAMFLSVVSFSVFAIHYSLAITGITAILIILFQLLFQHGVEMVVLPRFLGTALGCILVLVANSLLWPQWQSCRLDTFVTETTATYGELVLKLFDALWKKDTDLVDLDILKHRALENHTNLQVSYQQMLREPRHSQGFVDDMDIILKSISKMAAHIDALLILQRKAPDLSGAASCQLMEASYTALQNCLNSPQESPRSSLGNLISMQQRLEQDHEYPDGSDGWLVYYQFSLIFGLFAEIWQIKMKNDDT